MSRRADERGDPGEREATLAMIARCARHQHPEAFGGEEIAPAEVPGAGFEAIPAGFNAERIGSEQPVPA